jgi:hypothetical protein
MQVAPALETSFRPLEKFPAQAAPIKKALEWDTTKEMGKAPLFGNIPATPSPQMTKPRSVGVSAPVYSLPAETSVSGSPFSPGGNISFSSSHVLPSEKVGEKSEEKVPEKPNEYRKESIQKTLKPEASKGPEAISVITPRGNRFGFRGNAGQSAGLVPDDGFDAPRVVDLRNQKKSEGHSREGGNPGTTS